MNFKNKTVIGMIHLLPTLGYEGFTTKEKILARALEDLKILEKGKVDAVIIENNYDLPHKIKINKENLVIIGFVIGELKKKTKMPIGINILWNDYEAALSLAKVYDCEFVRVPVFVDHVKTAFGEIFGESKKVLEFRKKIKADHVQILADIQVKHAEILNKRPIQEAALDAIRNGAEGIIVTGKWTGDSPLISDLRAVKMVAGEIPVIVGSGADKDNLLNLFNFSDSVIVSTSLKEGEKMDRSKERNIKPYNAKIDQKKLADFMSVVTNLRMNMTSDK
jgi:membrane complex biogenesis BtpA family protein